MIAERESFDCLEPASKTPSFYFTDMMKITPQNPIKTTDGKRVELSGREIEREKHFLISQRSNNKYVLWLNICVGAALSIMGVLAAVGLGVAFGAVIFVLLAPMGVVLFLTAAKKLLFIHRIEKGSITAYEFDIVNNSALPCKVLAGATDFRQRHWKTCFIILLSLEAILPKPTVRNGTGLMYMGKKFAVGY